MRAALLWAQEHRVDLAIKGGGHSVAGTSSSEGGLVVDLCRMNGVTVDAANRTVTAQGGATWKEVDETAAAHGLATVGGTVNHTGVGGLTLGGGYGWLSGQYGLTIDNLLGATVVLADGRVVHASDDSEYSDLFWGLRGAGYNFGVVVDFTYRAYEQTNPVLAGIVAFPPDKLEAVVAALNKFLANPDEKAGAMCVFAQPPGAPGPMVNVVCVYNGTREAGEKRFAALLAEQPVVNTLAMVPYAELNALQNPMTSYGDRKSFKGLFFRPPLDAVFVRRIFSEFSAKVLGDPDLAASSLILEFVDMRKICAVSRTATAFASRNSTQNGVLCLRWTDAGKDAEHRLWARECQARWKAQLDAQVSGGDAEVPQYINYAERELSPFFLFFFFHVTHSGLWRLVHFILAMANQSSRRLCGCEYLRREPKPAATAQSKVRPGQCVPQDAPDYSGEVDRRMLRTCVEM